MLYNIEVSRKYFIKIITNPQQEILLWVRNLCFQKRIFAFTIFIMFAVLCLCYTFFDKKDRQFFISE